MAVRTPHFPDLLFPAAARLRRWEAALMGLLETQGYRELRPPMVMREPAPSHGLRFFDGEELVALRWDFTTALASLLVRTFQHPPDRVSYAGAVFRRSGQPWEAVERFEVGCERIQSQGVPSSDADLELARLLMSIPKALGLKRAILHLGNAALVRIPLEAEALPTAMADAVIAGLSRRAPHRILEAMAGHPAAQRFVSHAETLLSGLDGPHSLDALDASPYRDLIQEERAHMAQTICSLLPMLPPNLDLRVDLADVAGLGFYTGPTLRLWAPGAQQELAAGGRYDRLFPDLGRPWQAAGFCVRLSRVLDLAAIHPDLFEAPR